MEWMREGWRLFKLWPMAWMGMTALAFLVILGVTLLPFVGGYLVELLSPVLVAGYMLASRAAERGEQVNFLFLGQGFKEHLPALLVVGGIYLLAGLLVGQIVTAMGGASLQEMMRMAQDPAGIQPEQARAMLNQSLPVLFLGLALCTPLLMATWFAPALVVFRGFSPGNALWWSLWTCFANWRPVVVYSLVMGAFGLLAILIPMGLGLLVMLPVALISTYAAFGQLFVARESEA